MEAVNLEVALRHESGKGPAHRARQMQKIPGIFYGPHLEKPISVVMDEISLNRSLKTAHINTIFKLTGESKELSGKFAMVKDVQKNPVSDRRLHVDLYEVREGEEIRVRVPVKTLGRPKGIAQGGMLQVARRQLTLKCLPNKIPNTIEVDVSALMINDSIHVNDLTLPDGVNVISDVNFTVLTVVPPAKEEKKAEGEAEVAKVEEPAVAAEAKAKTPQ